ncbi:MAG: DUF2922 domain-containing protein [Dehalobacter sp. 4CP]|uniref:DUF2922 domain-containing protein n=1 Tax=Dehalobacter sp. CP TaxID=2594474 RepID=UPI0013C62CDB|nr:DUF2922 domain-containing protein [Dehalobacter sp. 4CP]
MAIVNNKFVRLTFLTAGGKTFAITVPNPRADMTKAEAEAVMDMIIARNIFNTLSGELSLKRDIRVFDNTTNDLYDPPV